MMNSLLRFLIIIIMGSFTSCASHAPMSQMVLFAPTNGQEGKTKGIAVDVDRNDFETLYPESGSKENEYYKTYGASFFRTFFIGDSLSQIGAFSMAFGKATGVDFTAKLLRPIYLSAGFSYPTHVNLSVPVKLVHTERLGIAAAPVFRNHVIYFEDKFDVIPAGFNSHLSIGLKTDIYSLPLINSDSPQNFLSLRIEAGRFLEPKSYYFSFGMRVGRF